MSRQARRTYHLHAALPQVCTVNGRCISRGGSQCDATESREVQVRTKRDRTCSSYALLVALIALVAIGAVTLAGQSVSTGSRTSLTRLAARGVVLGLHRGRGVRRAGPPFRRSTGGVGSAISLLLLLG